MAVDVWVMTTVVSEKVVEVVVKLVKLMVDVTVASTVIGTIVVVETTAVVVPWKSVDVVVPELMVETVVPEHSVMVLWIVTVHVSHAPHPGSNNALWCKHQTYRILERRLTDRRQETRRG